MAKRPSLAPDYQAITEELGIVRELASSQRAALDVVKKFLLDLHKQSVYLPAELQSQLAEVLSPILNGSFGRAKGRAAQRTREEKKAIVDEYFSGLAMGNGSAAAVSRKYGVHPRYIHAWRKEIETNSLPVNQKWMTRNDPWLAALSKLGRA